MGELTFAENMPFSNDFLTNEVSGFKQVISAEPSSTGEEFSKRYLPKDLPL